MSKKIKLSSITPDDKNNNKHTAYGMDLLEKSVNKVGIIESITVSNDDKIISGNARHEVIGKNFEKEALVIETDGTQPIIIKRTDIESDTKQFYEASILANTTAKKNIDFDMEVIDSLAVEYDIDIVDLGVDIIDYTKDSDEFGTEFSLKDGDKEPFQQMTFTLADEQAEQIKNAISEIKLTQEYKYAETMGNENSNGNALYLIIMQWAEQKK
mgnify:FL=1